MGILGLKRIKYDDSDTAVKDSLNKNFSLLEYLLTGKLDATNISNEYIQNVVNQYGVDQLALLTDVNIAEKIDQDVLTYDLATTKWIAKKVNHFVFSPVTNASQKVANAGEVLLGELGVDVTPITRIIPEGTVLITASRDLLAKFYVKVNGVVYPREIHKVFYGAYSETIDLQYLLPSYPTGNVTVSFYVSCDQGTLTIAAGDFQGYLTIRDGLAAEAVTYPEITVLQDGERIVLSSIMPALKNATASLTIPKQTPIPILIEVYGESLDLSSLMPTISAPTLSTDFELTTP